MAMVLYSAIGVSSVAIRVRSWAPVYVARASIVENNTNRSADQVIESSQSLIQHHWSLWYEVVSDGPAHYSRVVGPMADSVPHGKRDLLLLILSFTSVVVLHSEGPGLTSLDPSCAFSIVSGALIYSANLWRSVARMNSPCKVAMRTSPLFDLAIPSRTDPTGFFIKRMAAIHDEMSGKYTAGKLTVVTFAGFTECQPRK